MSNKVRVAILGPGDIGSDLTERLLRSEDFELVAVAGRRPDSPGLRRLESRVRFLPHNGLRGLEDSIDEIDGFF